MLKFTTYNYLITEAKQLQLFMTPAEATKQGARLDQFTPLLRNKLMFSIIDEEGNARPHEPQQRPGNGVWAGRVLASNNQITHTPQYGEKKGKDYPPVWMIIDTRHHLIAIERNLAFRNADKALKLLHEALSAVLAEHGLEISFTPITLPGDFWGKVREQCLTCDDEVRSVAVDIISAKDKTIVAPDCKAKHLIETLRFFTIPQTLRKALTWGAGRGKQGLDFLPERDLDEDTLQLINIAIQNEIAVEVRFKSGVILKTKKSKRKENETINFIATMPGDMALNDFLAGARDIDPEAEDGMSFALLKWLDNISEKTSRYGDIDNKTETGA